MKWPWSKEEINGHGACPTYLYRWTLLRSPWTCIYLHHFVGNDWSRDFHDHPKRFISIGLKGEYIEETPYVNRYMFDHMHAEIKTYHAPWIRSFAATHAHRICAIDCWTLVIVGPKTREWGFWHKDPTAPGRWIPWNVYVNDPNIVEKVKACD